MNEIRGQRILDVGCGCGVYGYLLRNKWQDTPTGKVQFEHFSTRDLNNDEPALLVGVDIQLENIRRCAKHNIYDVLALCNARNLPFPDNYVDTILCIEVLEHLTKEDAFLALHSFERIAQQRIVITVPKAALDSHTGADERHFLHVETKDPEVLEWIEAETHKCSFSISDLRRLGFRIGREAHHGWRAPIHLALKLWQNYGWRSGQILAVKELNKAASSIPTIEMSPPCFTERFPDYR